jgi:hypothetical protein
LIKNLTAWPPVPLARFITTLEIGVVQPAKSRRGEVPTPNTKPGLMGVNDARTGMPPGMPEGAMCVQRFDDSLNSAIHITYRISLRSSSMPEPRDPLLKVFIHSSKTPTYRDRVGWSTGGGGGRSAPEAKVVWSTKGWGRGRGGPPSLVMIPPQVHLRRPCYDFYFL